MSRGGDEAVTYTTMEGPFRYVVRNSGLDGGHDDGKEEGRVASSYRPDRCFEAAPGEGWGEGAVTALPLGYADHRAEESLRKRRRSGLLLGATGGARDGSADCGAGGGEASDQQQTVAIVRVEEEEEEEGEGGGRRLVLRVRSDDGACSELCYRKGGDGEVGSDVDGDDRLYIARSAWGHLETFVLLSGSSPEGGAVAAARDASGISPDDDRGDDFIPLGAELSDVVRASISVEAAMGWAVVRRAREEGHVTPVEVRTIIRTVQRTVPFLLREDGSQIRDDYRLTFHQFVAFACLLERRIESALAAPPQLTGRVLEVRHSSARIVVTSTKACSVTVGVAEANDAHVPPRSDDVTSRFLSWVRCDVPDDGEEHTVTLGSLEPATEYYAYLHGESFCGEAKEDGDESRSATVSSSSVEDMVKSRLRIKTKAGPEPDLYPSWEDMDGEGRLTELLAVIKDKKVRAEAINAGLSFPCVMNDAEDVDLSHDSWIPFTLWWSNADARRDFCEREVKHASRDGMIRDAAAKDGITVRSGDWNSTDPTKLRRWKRFCWWYYGIEQLRLAMDGLSGSHDPGKVDSASTESEGDGGNGIAFKEISSFEFPDSAIETSAISVMRSARARAPTLPKGASVFSNKQKSEVRAPLLTAADGLEINNLCIQRVQDQGLKGNLLEQPTSDTPYSNPSESMGILEAIGTHTSDSCAKDSLCPEREATDYVSPEKMETTRSSASLDENCTPRPMRDALSVSEEDGSKTNLVEQVKSEAPNVDLSSTSSAKAALRSSSIRSRPTSRSGIRHTFLGAKTTKINVAVSKVEGMLQFEKDAKKLKGIALFRAKARLIAISQKLRHLKEKSKQEETTASALADLDLFDDWDEAQFEADQPPAASPKEVREKTPQPVNTNLEVKKEEPDRKAELQRKLAVAQKAYDLRLLRKSFAALLTSKNNQAELQRKLMVAEKAYDLRLLRRSFATLLASKDNKRDIDIAPPSPPKQVDAVEPPIEEPEPAVPAVIPEDKDDESDLLRLERLRQELERMKKETQSMEFEDRRSKSYREFIHEISGLHHSPEVSNSGAFTFFPSVDLNRVLEILPGLAYPHGSGIRISDYEYEKEYADIYEKRIPPGGSVFIDDVETSGSSGPSQLKSETQSDTVVVDSLPAPSVHAVEIESTCTQASDSSTVSCLESQTSVEKSSSKIEPFRAWDESQDEAVPLESECMSYADFEVHLQLQQERAEAILLRQQDDLSRSVVDRERKKEQHRTQRERLYALCKEDSASNNDLIWAGPCTPPSKHRRLECHAVYTKSDPVGIALSSPSLDKYRMMSATQRLLRMMGVHVAEKSRHHEVGYFAANTLPEEEHLSYAHESHSSPGETVDAEKDADSSQHARQSLLACFGHTLEPN